MAYSDFTLRTLRERFGITTTDADDLFADVTPLPPTDFFVTLLRRHLPLVRGLGTEKVRAEMIIAPLLVELREQSGHQIAVFSGAEFGVDAAQGLYGFCAFLVSRSPTVSRATSCTARSRAARTGASSVSTACTPRWICRNITSKTSPKSSASCAT